mgnify:CR=1 FL=1
MDPNYSSIKKQYYERFNNGVYENPENKYTDQQSTDILMDYLDYKTLGYNHINTYNYWIKMNSKNNLAMDKEIIYEEKDGTKIRVYFDNLVIKTPMRVEKGVQYILTPQYCRQNNVTYACEWWLDFIKTRMDTGEILEKKSQHIANIPLMLKSDACVLHGKTPNELRLLGEDPDDCGGYFIVEGTEKVLMYQEKMSLQKIYVLESKSKNKSGDSKNKDSLKECRITISLKNGKTVVCSLNNSKENIIEYKLVSIKYQEDLDKKGLKKKISTTGQQTVEKINVLRIFRLFGITNFDDIRSMIGRYIKPENREKCLQRLVYTISDIYSENNDVDLMRYKIQKIQKIPDNISEKDLRKIIEDTLNLDLFPNLDNPEPYAGESAEDRKKRSVLMKLQTLSSMIAKYLEVLCGFRSPDDRDSWSNKLVETAGNLMEKHLKTSWESCLNSINDKIANKQISSFNEILKNIGKDITNEFTSSFIQPEWGVKGKSQKKNVTQILNRDSIIATNAHLATINVGVPRTDNLPQIRIVQNSQFPIVCYITTAEGENCGIVKNISILTYVSLGVSDKDIKRQIMGDVNLNLPPMVFNEESENNKDIVFVNSGFMGYCNAVSLKKFLIEGRRNGLFPIEMSVIHINDILHIDLSPSRPMSPFLIVNEDQQLEIDRKGLRGAPIHELIASGCIEFISSWEQESIKLATNPNNIYQRVTLINSLKKEYEKSLEILEKVTNGETILDSTGKVLDLELAQSNVEFSLLKYNRHNNTLPYTHCMIHGLSSLGISATLVPLANHNQAPRNVYQVNMGKQALGVYHENHINRYDTKSKILAFPSPPIGDTVLGTTIGIDTKSQGQSVVVAFSTFEHTQEDAFVLKDEALQAGMFRNYKYAVYSSEKKKNIEPGVKEEYCLPSKVQGADSMRYRYIQENGLPALQAYLKSGDCVIGKVETHTEPNGEKKQVNKSTFLKIGESGIVTKIFVTSNSNTIYVKLRLMRIPREGDKFAPRCAQKGTIGEKKPRHLLPCSIDTGIIPDLFVNTHCIPARMTISYLIELLGTKAGAYIAEKIDLSAFRSPNINLFSKILSLEGLEKFGKERTFSGETGEEHENKLFMGPVYFQTLKHHVADKIQARGIGVLKPMTRQPLRGRGNLGGIRFGEMERDCCISHGSSAFGRERLCWVSDRYKTVICTVCGDYAVNNTIKDKFVCKACGNENQENFGKTDIAYVFKYFQHILSAAGIKIRPKFITNENYKKEIFGNSSETFVNEILDAEDVFEEEPEDEIEEDEGDDDYYDDDD